MKKFVLIVAGGQGSRMKNSIPKQFIEVGGKPILMHTFDVFQKYHPKIEFILVLPKNLVGQWKMLCSKFQFELEYKLAFGGETRFHSVKNGLDIISEEGIVFIHDGARPLVSDKTIQNCYKTALKKGNALPVIPVPESIRKITNGENLAVDRSKYYLVQTPQTFKVSLIQQAFKQDYLESFTDDASVLEKMGDKINLVEGNRENIKITYPEDLMMAKTFLVNNIK